MIINNNSVEQINVALLDLEKKLSVANGSNGTNGRTNILGRNSNSTSGFIPVGTLLHGLYVNIPAGFLPCIGQEVRIEDYPELYAVIGQLKDCRSENEGMFKIPDFRECVLVGAGTSGRPSTELKAHDSYELCQFKDDQMQSHTHTVTVPNKNRAQWTIYPIAGAYYSDGDETKTSSNSNGRTGTTTHGKQIGVTYIIKY